MTKARDLANASTALSAVDATELGYLDGVTSAVQTQLDAKTAKSTLTTTGDIYYASAANTPARLGIGTTDQVLKVTAGVPAWATPASGGSQTLLSTTTLSGTSTTISSISQSYRALYIYGANIQTTAGSATLRLRWNGHTIGYYGNAAIAGAYSTYQSVRFANAGGIQDDNATRASIADSGNCQFYINFPEYTATGFKLGTGWFNPSYSEDVMSFAALNDTSTSAVTSFTITTVDGATSLTGTIKVYGVN